MKKILGLIALFAIIVLSCFYFFIKQPKNIFDEIYQETEKTYRTNNILRKSMDLKSDLIGQVMESILNIIHLELIIKIIPQKTILKSKLVLILLQEHN